jgi:chorismate mutase/prephenate dehydratase
MFVTSELKICAEILIEVSLALLCQGGPVANIEKVCSHPHALAQCKTWLKNNLPHAVAYEVSSTAMAAKIASEDPATAAIASVAAANLYDLTVIEKNIEDNRNNFTRFLVIGKREAKKTGADKTSLLFAIKDAPGALYEILKPFATRGLNLTKIESRPIKTKAWEYLFYIDLDGHLSDENVREALAEFEPRCSFLKVLGSYPKSC